VKLSLIGFLRRLPRALHAREERRLGHLEPDVERDGEQDERQEKRQAPSPRLERVLAEDDARRSDDAHAEEEAERGGRLDEARVVAAAIVGHVLGDVRRGAAVFAAEREPLDQAQRDE
jgi:hypothetical protein